MKSFEVINALAIDQGNAFLPSVIKISIKRFD